MDKLIIDRAKWYRGKGSRESRLLLTDGQRCCLGFDLQRRGFTDERLLNVGTPEEVNSEEEIVGLTFAYEDARGFGPTCTNEELIGANDDPDTDEQSRESRIVELFAGIDVEVIFVN